MKNKKDLFDPFGDVTVLILLIMLTLGLAIVAIATTKFVYDAAGILSAIGWVLGWIAMLLLSTWLTKKLFD
tara:strand:- start:106 stop:318 length:213 start_codon:yes stop_codon:yes gene_type:complete